MPAAMQTLKNVSPKGWAMIGGGVAATIVFIVLLMHFASSASYSTLETGVDPAQTGKIESTLAARGIAYQVQDGGTAIAVASGKTAQARVALATAGLLTNEQPGFSLLDKSSLGQSNFQQLVTYERALEGQLDSTIQSISGVSGATVNLVIPNSQDELFSDQAQSASASVLLSGSSALQPGAVRGIADLVSSSVPGLSSAKVTITGGDGSVLWPSSSAGTSGAPTQQAANEHYDTAMEGQLSAMLAQTLGVGKAEVEVNAQLNANKATQEALTYNKQGAVPLTQQKQAETLTGNGSIASGTAGTASNTPAYTTGSGSGNGKSNYKNITSNTNYGVDKTITHTVLAAGGVQQQSVAVLLSKTVPASDVAAIKQAVTNAAGIQAKRGDQLSVSQIAFVPVTKTKLAPAVSPISKYGKYGALGLGTLAFLIFVARMLRRRERESFGEPTWLSELEAPRTLASLEAGANPGQPAEIAPLHAPVNVARKQVEELVARDPERVAQQVRAWMAEE